MECFPGAGVGLTPQYASPSCSPAFSSSLLQVLLPRSLPKCSPHLRAVSLRTQPVTCPKSLLKDLHCHENHLLCHAMCWNLSPEIVRRETLLTSLRKTHRIPNSRPLCFLLLKRRQNGVFVYCLIYPLSYVTKTAYL